MIMSIINIEQSGDCPIMITLASHANKGWAPLTLLDSSKVQFTNNIPYLFFRYEGKLRDKASISEKIHRHWKIRTLYIRRK